MHKIFTIARKEFKETLRDRRTLMIMVVMPLLVFPVIFTVISKIESSFQEKENKKPLKVAIANAEEAPDFISFLNEAAPAGQMDYEINVQLAEDTSNFESLIREDSIDLGLYLQRNFGKIASSDSGSASIMLFYEMTNEKAQKRFNQLIAFYEARLLNGRLQNAGLTPSFVKPILVDRSRDISTMKEKIGKYAGGFLPYIFISFCFLGCMYPAIDLFSGEKERGTFETLLTTPVHRSKILIGKLMVVSLSGITSAVLALVGLIGSIYLTDLLPAAWLSVVSDIFDLQFILLFFLMLIPLTIFFAGIMISISVYAKSYKEAQSIITPLNIIFVLPAVIGFLPGLDLNLGTAFIPIINIVLSTKEIIAETLNPVYLLIVMLSLLGMASFSIWLSFRQFDNEQNIIRT